MCVWPVDPILLETRPREHQHFLWVCMCVCVCQWSTRVFAVRFVNVGQCGWAQVPCDVRNAACLRIHSKSSPHSHHQVHSISTPCQPPICHVLNVNCMALNKGVSIHLLEIAVPTNTLQRLCKDQDFHHPFIPHFSSRNAITELGLVWHLMFSY